jgi:hypothetical protein
MRWDFEVVIVVVLVLPVSGAMVAGVDTLLGEVVLLLYCGSTGGSIEVISRVKKERASVCVCEREREREGEGEKRGLDT